VQKEGEEVLQVPEQRFPCGKHCCLNSAVSSLHINVSILDYYLDRKIMALSVISSAGYDLE